MLLYLKFKQYKNNQTVERLLLNSCGLTAVRVRFY